MAKIKLMPIGYGLEIERAISPGGRSHGYKISREGLSAIEDYVTQERAADFKKWKSPALFLSPASNAHGDGRLNPRVINTVFNEVMQPGRCRRSHAP